MLPTIETATREVYKVGRFVFDAEGNDVTVTKDTAGGILSVAFYQYRNHEAACEAAYKLAMRQKAA